MTESMTTNSIIPGALSAILWVVGSTADSASGTSFGQVCAIGVGIWYLSARLARQDAQLKHITERLDNLPCKPKCAEEQPEEP